MGNYFAKYEMPTYSTCSALFNFKKTDEKVPSLFKKETKITRGISKFRFIFERNIFLLNDHIIFLESIHFLLGIRIALNVDKNVK